MVHEYSNHILEVSGQSTQVRSYTKIGDSQMVPLGVTWFSVSSTPGPLSRHRAAWLSTIFMRPISSAPTISSYLARIRYKMNKMCSRNGRGFPLDQTDPHCNSSSLFTAGRRRGLKGRNSCSCSYGVGVGAGGEVEKTLL